jgi:AcrR family transcriptional regulator
MARPRQLTDDELLDRVAPGLSSPSWSLNEAARLAEVHPATLIKRFGSRQGVLTALSRRWVENLPDGPTGQGGLAELLAWVSQVAITPQDRGSAVAGIAMLMEDLKDAELSRLLATGWGKQATYLAVLVAQARETRDLQRAPAPEVAAQLLLDVQLGATVRAAAHASPRVAVDRHALLSALIEGWR